MKRIVNREIMPETIFIVIIQNGKAVPFSQASAFAEQDKAFAFTAKEHADFFIANYKKGLTDYREAMLKDDYIFFVLDLIMNNSAVYADDIRMSADWQPFS